MTKYKNTGTESFSIRGVEFLPGIPMAAPEGLPESKLAFIAARCEAVEIADEAPAQIVSRKLTRAEKKAVDEHIDATESTWPCSGQLTFACLVTGGMGVFCDNVLIDTIHIVGICGD